MSRKISRDAHEHFCWRCFGHKTNGSASGWVQCAKRQCPKPPESPCRKHAAEQEKEMLSR
jgi:hypothetical protein